MRNLSLMLGGIAMLTACTSYGHENAQQAPTAEAPEASQSQMSAPLEGVWTLTEVNGNTVIKTRDHSPAQTPATLTFEDGRIGANAYCNMMSTDYTASASAGTIETGIVIRTLMACQDVMEQENTISSILDDLETFQISSDKILTLTASDGRTLKAKR